MGVCVAYVYVCIGVCGVQYFQASEKRKRFIAVAFNSHVTGGALNFFFFFF